MRRPRLRRAANLRGECKSAQISPIAQCGPKGELARGRWSGAERRPGPKSSAVEPRGPRAARPRAGRPAAPPPPRAGAPPGRGTGTESRRRRHLNILPLPPSRRSDARRGKVFLGGLSWDTAEGAPGGRPRLRNQPGERASVSPALSASSRSRPAPVPAAQSASASTSSATARRSRWCVATRAAIIRARLND